MSSRAGVPLLLSDRTRRATIALTAVTILAWLIASVVASSDQTALAISQARIVTAVSAMVARRVRSLSSSGTPARELT